MKRLIINLVSFLIPFTIYAAPQIKNISGEDLLTAQKVNVSADGKKGLVVVFLSAKCPCSNSHVTELKDLASKFPEFTYVAVHSNVDEGKDLSKPYFEKAAFPFPVIEDKKSELADLLQAFKTPHSFILLPNGNIAYQGGVSNSKDCAKSDRKYLREALQDLDAGKTVRTPEGRTLGCAISRGEKNVW
jgi:peroxiredoxin